MSTFKTNVHLGTKDPMIDADSIADGAIATDKIADKAVTNAKLACDSVGSCQIQDGAVTLEKTTGLIPYVTERVGNESRARASAINQLQSRIAQVDASAVKTITVNSGGKHYPDNAGNVNLVIGQGGGGGEDLARQVAANTEAISELQDAVGELAREGETMKPFAEKLSEEFAPDIEQMGYAGLGGEVVWSPFYAQFLLRVTSGGETKYYSAWNGNDDRIPSEAYEDPSDGFWYIQTENGAQLYHWEPGVVDLLPISGNGVLDDALDESSENAVKNHVIYEAVLSLRNRIAPLERDEKILPLAGVNYGSPENLQSYGYEGDRGDIYYYPALKRFYLTAVSGGAGARVLKSYSAWVACGAYRSNEDYVLEKNFYYFVDGDEIHILHWSASGNKMMELTKGETGSSVIRAYDWSDLESRKTDGWEVGKYWYDTDNYVLKQCVSVQPLSFTTIRDLHLVLNPKDGKMYEIDSAEEDLPRLLDTGDLNDIKDEIAQAVGNTGDTPMGAIVNGVTTENVGLSAFASGYVYDLVWDKAIKALLLRCREVLTWYEPAIDSGARRIPKTFGAATYYRTWSVSGKAPDYVPYSASDFELKAKEDYLNDAELERSGVKGFYYTTDGETLTIWKWDAEAGDLVATGGGDISEYAEQIEENTAAIQRNSSAIVTLQNAMEAIGAVDPLSPEAYGAVPDGIDLWNRPLRNYRDDVENVEDSGYFDVEIPLPDCYIPYPERWSQPSELTKKLVPEFLPVYEMEVEGETVEVHLNTNLIFYDTAKRLFVLNIGGSYYSSWKNSHEWNNNSLARIDCVYCRTWDRSTFLFDGNSMIDIMDTDGQGTPLMTDNRAAIERCLKANKGSMRLTPGKIYFCTVDDTWTKQSTANPFYNIDGFEIDGRGATLYLRSVLPGVDAYGTTPSTSTFMWMYNCRNGKIKNLAIKALRDRSNQCAARTYLRYSASDSRLTAFGVHRCKNIEFENLELLNMHEDFSIKDPDRDTVTPETRNNNISISRVKSRGVCVNAAAYVDNLRVDRVDVEGYPYIGGGCHLIYGQTQLQKMYVTNSRFAVGPITECVFTFHYSPNGNITVENTVIDGADWIRGYSSVTHKQKYVNCEFRQTLPVQYDNTGRSISRPTKPLVLNATAHYEFVGCRFITKPVLTGTGYMLERAGDGSAETSSVVTFRDCVMEAVSADTVTNFFKWSGTNYLLTVDGCTFKSSRAAVKIGLTASDIIVLTNNKVMLCQTIDNDYVTKLVEELTGHPAEVPKYSAVPTDAVVGDYYYDTTVGKFFKCTSVSGGAASWEQVKSLAERVAALE